jgi:hypothetical protein
VPITISADDPRTIRAIEIAAEADRWQSCRTARGEQGYKVPSQSQAGLCYVVTTNSCECPDFRRNELAPADDDRACKHMLAVRLHSELVKAQRYLSRPTRERSRGHLRLLPRPEPGG